MTMDKEYKTTIRSSTGEQKTYIDYFAGGTDEENKKTCMSGAKRIIQERPECFIDPKIIIARTN